MTTNSVVIALDVGGSSVKSGIVTTELKVQAIKSTPLNSKGSADEILATFADIVRGYLDDYTVVRGVGVGFPSPFDYENGICLIQGVDKYEAIYNVNIGDAIRARAAHPHLTIRFRNDAESALVGEAIYGAGQPYERFIGVTLGTGLGSSFIADGKRIKSGKGIPDGGFLFPVHFRGEQSDEWFSTRGLLRRLAQAGMSFETVADASQLADNGNKSVQAIFAEFGSDMAQFLNPFLIAFDAQALLVSGGIANAFHLFGDALIAGVSVPVVRGQLGTTAALLGAADLILQDDY